MTGAARTGKLYAIFTVIEHDRFARLQIRAGKGARMVGIAIAMFIALFGWGAKYFGWNDPDGKVQLALATCFILGVISGYKAKS
jgi:hypothetical protein